MRALCGAIICAGAAIGLGLTSLGFGTRYHSSLPPVDRDGQTVLLHLADMDRPMVFILVFLTCVALIGLGIAFFGLAYHHHRLYQEFMRSNPPPTTRESLS